MWPISQIKRKLHERRAKYESQTPEQQAAWRTANATGWIAIFTIALSVVGGITLYEVIAGGTDTHDLAEAAKKQSVATVQQMGYTAALALVAKDQADRTKTIAEQAVVQAHAAGVAAQAASSAAGTAADQLVLGERPWVKINHRVLSPLTFNIGGRASGKDVALMTIEDTLENVGQSVAVNVLSWEDVIPLDADFTDKTARARQAQWCGENSHRRQDIGNTLFPHDPMIQQSTVGPTMEAVLQSAANNPVGLTGKVSFVLVGCVVYRSSFEPQTRPAHETLFVYRLGIPQGAGIQPYVFPTGVASSLQLVAFPLGFNAN